MKRKKLTRRRFIDRAVKMRVANSASQRQPICRLELIFRENCSEIAGGAVFLADAKSSAISSLHIQLCAVSLRKPVESCTRVLFMDDSAQNSLSSTII